ncbi:MAG: hypothetical protein IJ407_05370 [Clostridia bacterium]|nr:hypothetical protein [Clostridia bacterium]
MISMEKIDPNFSVPEEITEPDLIWVDVKNAPFALYGVFYDEENKQYQRLPSDVAEAANEGVVRLNRFTSGGRIRFRTDSSFLGIRVVQRNDKPARHMARSGQSGFDLYRKKEGDDRMHWYHTYKPSPAKKEGFSEAFHTDGAFAEYTFNFPLYDGVDALYIALKKDCRLEAAAPYTYEKPVLYYGSSITQGGCASRPGNSYQGMLSVLLDTNFINLGFSGSGKGEQAMAEYIAGQEMSVFVMDYDHNAPTVEHLEATHLPFYRTVRAAQPDLPIILISAPDQGREHRQAPLRAVVRATYETAVAEGDKHVYFIDGSSFFRQIDLWDCCTVDDSHPNDLGFYLMAKGIEKVLRPILEKENK